MPDAVAVALERVVAELPGGGEARLGQREMADAVRLGIAERKHLAVQAGTGTGKTLAYLVPAILSGRRTVVATATKALQDQLAGKDLPFLEQHLDHPFSWAVLKGRSNYLCMQRLSEVVATGQDDGQLALDGVAERAPAEELLHLSTWAATSLTGDRAELEVEPSERAWSAVSVSARECPGAARCPSGGICFAEAARDKALEADVVVVNLHLYGLDLAMGGVLLPGARARHHRRGAPARGHRVRHLWHRAHRRALRRSRPARSRRDRRRPAPRRGRRRGPPPHRGAAPAPGQAPQGRTAR